MQEDLPSLTGHWRQKLCSCSMWRSDHVRLKKMAKRKTKPIAGARHVILQLSEPHHPDTKNKDIQEEGEGVTQVKRQKPA